MQIKCPKCATVLKVADPTGPVKIKCPNCATVLQVGGGTKPATPKQPARQAAASKPVGHNPIAAKTSTSQSAAPQQSPPMSSAQPAASPAPTMAPDGGFDFLDLPSPDAGQQPVRQFTQVSAPTRRPAPAPKPRTDSGDGGTDDTAPKRKAKTNISGMSKGTIAVLIGGVAVMLLLLVVGVVVLASGSGKTASTSKRAPPDGFEYKSINGVSAFMPKGLEVKGLPGKMDMIVVETDSTTQYVLGSTTPSNLDLTVDKLQSRLQGLMAAGIIGGSPHERNGYRGFTYKLDQGVKLQNMRIEVFQNEGRIIVMGVSNANAGGGGNYVVGQNSDPELRNVFLESLEIAPPSSGWSW